MGFPSSKGQQPFGGFGSSQPSFGGGSSLYPANPSTSGKGGKYGQKKGSFKGSQKSGNPFGSKGPSYKGYKGQDDPNSGKGQGQGKGKKGVQNGNPFSEQVREIGFPNCPLLLSLCRLPHHLRHWEDVQALTMMQGKLISGSRDKYMSIWNGKQTGDRMVLEAVNSTQMPSGVTCFLYEPNSGFLFVGLFTGQIKAFQRQPSMELVLKGHERAITCLYIFDKFLLSAAKDATFRVWVYQPEKRLFENQLTIPSPVGEISCLRVVGSDINTAKIWLGGEKGIASVDMKQLTVDGIIETPAPVCGPFFVFNDEHVILGLKDGSMRCYSAINGDLEYDALPSGDHKANHAMDMMIGPGGKIYLLCGHDFGWIHVYDIPSFEPVGTFCVNKQERPRITSICDCGNNEMFAVGTERGDVCLYKWLPGGLEAPAIAIDAPTGSIAGFPQTAPQTAMGTPQVNPFTGHALGAGQPDANQMAI